MKFSQLRGVTQKPCTSTMVVDAGASVMEVRVGWLTDMPNVRNVAPFTSDGVDQMPDLELRLSADIAVRVRDVKAYFECGWSRIRGKRCVITSPTRGAGAPTLH